MKILITGAAGFIGSFLSRELLKKGIDVVGIDNFDMFYDKKAKDFNLSLTGYLTNTQIFSDFGEVKTIAELLNIIPNGRVGKFKFFQMDIRNEEEIDQLFSREKFDVLVHLAALAGVPHSMKYPKEYTDVNVVGTLNLIQLATKYNIPKFVFASSSSIYGDSTEDKFAETLDTDKPISPYAATKKMGEVMNYTFHSLYGIKVANVRIFTAYGPLQRPVGMAIQKFIKSAVDDKELTIYGDGTMLRDFTYIDDLVDGFACLVNSDFEYLNINLGSDSPVSVNFLAEEIINKVGKGRVVHLDKPSTEVGRTSADISLAQKLLKFNPKVSIKDGLAKQIEVYKAMPEWYKKLSS